MFKNIFTKKKEDKTTEEFVKQIFRASFRDHEEAIKRQLEELDKIDAIEESEFFEPELVKKSIVEMKKSLLLELELTTALKEGF